MLGLVGLGAHALPVAVGVDSGRSLLAVPASTPSGAAAPLSRPTPTAEPSSASPTPTVAPTPEPATPGKPKKATVKAKPIKVPATGPGSYDRSDLDLNAASDRGRLIRYDVRVEDNLDVDPEDAARQIETVLNDKRSWRGSGRWRFQLVSSASEASLHAYIVTPGTTDRLCAPLLTRGAVSCQNGDKVVLNARRWLLGADSYGSDLAGYRRYLINHEFGHSLGYQHVTCPGRGKPAPVMMQQTKGLGGCRKNPWPLAND